MYLTSFFCLLHFIFFSVFALTNPRKINYLSVIYGHLQAVLRGCFAKVFYPLTIIGKLQAVCWGISRKFYKKIAENFSRQLHIKRKSDITRTSFFRFYYKSLSRQNSKRTVTVGRRFCEVSKGNSTLIRRNRNSKQVPICYPFLCFLLRCC